MTVPKLWCASLFTDRSVSGLNQRPPAIGSGQFADSARFPTATLLFPNPVLVCFNDRDNLVSQLLQDPACQQLPRSPVCWKLPSR